KFELARLCRRGRRKERLEGDQNGKASPKRHRRYRSPSQARNAELSSVIIVIEGTIASFGGTDPRTVRNRKRSNRLMLARATIGSRHPALGSPGAVLGPVLG